MWEKSEVTKPNNGCLERISLTAAFSTCCHQRYSAASPSLTCSDSMHPLYLQHNDRPLDRSQAAAGSGNLLPLTSSEAKRWWCVWNKSNRKCFLGLAAQHGRWWEKQKQSSDSVIARFGDAKPTSRQSLHQPTFEWGNWTKICLIFPLHFALEI